MVYVKFLLLICGFTQFYSDYKVGLNFLVILVYMEDLIICVNNSSTIAVFKDY